MNDLDRESRADAIYRRVRKLKTAKLFSCWNARSLISSYKSFGMFCDDDRIVDVGCARSDICLAMPRSCEYVGIDIHQETIDAAKQIFDQDNCEFRQIDIREPKYNPKGAMSETAAVLPVVDEWANCVIARSLFTHFRTIEGVQHYLGEFLRILQSGGLLFVTWFRSPPNEHSESQLRRVFSQRQITESLKGFTVQHEWGGRTAQHEDQWSMVCRKEST